MVTDALAVVVCLCVVAISPVACGRAEQAADTSTQVCITESQTETTGPASDQPTTLVRPVEFQEAAEEYVPGSVTVLSAAESFTPPEEMPLFRITPVEPVTRETMDALATKLGMGQERQYGEEGLSGPGGNLIFPRADDAKCFLFDASAALDAAFIDILAGQPPQPPSPAETRSVADAYLASLGMQDDLVFLGVREGAAYGTHTLGGEEERWVVSMRADYQALVGGRPLVGAGSKVQVHVNPSGRVVAFCHLAQSATMAEEKVAIRPVEAALADLRSGKGEVPPNIDKELAKSITVEGIDMCYYAPPASLRVVYYKPAYVFHVRMSDGSLGDWLLSAFEGSTAEGAI
jgi:hypothetical protein